MDLELELLIADEARLETAVAIIKKCNHASFEFLVGDEGREKQFELVSKLNEAVHQVTKKIRQINRSKHS